MKKFKITLKDNKGVKKNFFIEKITFQEAVYVAYQKRAKSGFSQIIVGVEEV